MLVLVVLALLGFLWLLNRLLVLLSVPLDRSIKYLNVSIPPVPLISIDKVTHSSMVLHWDYPVDDDDHEQTADGPPVLSHTSPKSISHYLLYINGIQTAVIDGNLQSCVISGLNPESNYQVDLVAFNIANFRSKSSPVYVKTGKNDMAEPDHPDELLNVLIPDDERETVTKKSTFRQKSPASRSRSNTVDQENYKARIHPHLITDINELKFLLETGLEAVRSLTRAGKELETDFVDEEASLLAARNEAKERRKLEDQNRSSLRQEIKFLEETRMRSESRIASDQTKLATRRRKIEEKRRQMQEWEAILAEKRAAKEQLAAAEPAELETLKLQVEQLNKDIFRLQTEIHDVEEDIKYESANRKRLDALKQHLQGLFESLRTCIDEQTGILRPEGQAVLATIIGLKPDWEQDLKNEFTLDEHFELQWRALRQNDKEKIDHLKRQLDEKRSRPSSQYEGLGSYNDGSISNILSTAMSRMNTAMSYNTLSPEPVVSTSPKVWNAPAGGQRDMFFNLLDQPQSSESPPPSHMSNFDFLPDLNIPGARMGYGDNLMFQDSSSFGMQPTMNAILPNTSDDQLFANGLDLGMSTSPGVRDSSKFFGSLGSHRKMKSSGSVADSSQDAAMDFDLSRARSTSFGSSIWNNGGSNSNWASMNILDKQLSGDMVPKIYIENEEKQDKVPSSPSFFKNKLFKFGTSPTKTATKSSDRSEDTSVGAEEELSSGSMSSSATPGLLSSSFGSKSSRFFKLKKNQSDDQALDTRPDSPSGNLISRRLSFAFKRGDKDKDPKNDSIIEEAEE
ncbi:hypothetical protein KL938_003947 [Ogataea parapolymorpha]|nr:hypothetical protein KL938_003947 [Ogataea parapolymorpha]